MWKILAGVSAALVVASCESTFGPGHPKGIEVYAADKRLGDKVETVCFAEQIERFRNPEERTVVLRYERKEYLVEVNPGCWEMDTAGFVGIVPSDKGEFCLGVGNSLWVSRTAAYERARLGPQVCTVTDVRQWYGRFEDRPVTTEENPA